MSASQDSLDFGYDEFYDAYLSVPYYYGLMGLSKAILVSPSIFSAKNPQHVCVAALHGHTIYPFDERTIKERVKKDGVYHKTLTARMKIHAEVVAQFNDWQKREGWKCGGVITIVLDENEPCTQEDFERFGLRGTPVAKAALEYETDCKFFSLGQSGRLNHFARHFGFPNLEALQAFVRRLDDEAINMGFPSYASFCVATRYMDNLSKVYAARPSAQPALSELEAKRDLLKHESVFVIERFMACRVTDEGESFYVDINEEGVFINLRGGPLKGEAGIVTSKYLSDRSSDFHSRWFA